MNTNSSYDKENHPPGEWLEYEGGNRQKRRSSILVNPSLISVTGGSEKKVGRSALVDRPSSFMKKTNLNNRDVEEQNGSQMDDEETEREPNDDRKENILELKHGVKGSGIKAKIASTTKYLSNGSSASKNNHGNRRVSFAATAHVRIFDKHENEWTESPEKDDCENKSEEWKNTNQGMETINTRFTQFKTEEDGEEEEEEDIYKKDQVQAQNIPSDDHDVIESLQIPDIISNDQKHGTVLSQSLEMINVPKEDESIIENDENDTMEMTSCLGSIFRQDEFDDMDTTDMSLQSLPDNVVQQVLSRKDSFLLLPEKLSSVWHEEEFTMNQKSNEQLLDQVDTMQMTTSFGYVIQQNDSSSDSDFNSDNDLQKELFVSCGNDMTVTMQLTGEVNNILCKKSEDNQQADVCQESTMDLKVMDQPLLNFSYHDKREEQTMELTQCNPELHEQNFIKNSASECTETVIFRSDAQFKSRVDEQTNYVITGVQHKSENIALSGTHIDSPILAVSLHSSVVAPSVDQGMNLSASLKMTNNIAEKAPDTIPVLMKTTFSASEHIEAMIELNDIEKFKDKKVLA